MLLQTELLETHIVLEHLSEVDCHTLADGAVDGVVDVQLLQSEVGGVEHGENTDDSVVVNFVASKTQRDQLIVSEQQLGYHHCTARFDFVQVKVQTLQVRALLERLSQVLRALALDLVSHEVEVKKSN